jgi:predicted amidophosphoribosyltransferase
MPVANCPKCNKVFQRTVNPLCPTCHQETLSNVSVVYRFVQEHPQQTLEQIAKHCNLTAKELETIVFSGKLGTAAHQIIFYCQGCNRKVSALKRKGHFCPECAVKLEPKNATAEVSERKAPKTARTRPAIPSPEEIIEEEVAETFAEPPQKHESVSPLLDSYGFKRASEK